MSEKSKSSFCFCSWSLPPSPSLALALSGASRKIASEQLLTSKIAVRITKRSNDQFFMFVFLDELTSKNVIVCIIRFWVAHFRQKCTFRHRFITKVEKLAHVTFFGVFDRRFEFRRSKRACKLCLCVHQHKMTNDRPAIKIFYYRTHLAHRAPVGNTDLCTCANGNKATNHRFVWSVGCWRSIWCKIHVLYFQNEIRPLNPLSKTIKIWTKTNWLKCCISFRSVQCD